MKRSTTIRDNHRRIIARGQPPCALCGSPIDYTLKAPHPKSFVVDHIVPLSKGGEDSLANKQPACRDCNRDKADKEFGSTMRLTPGIVRPGD